MEHENDPYCGQKPFNGHTSLPWRSDDERIIRQDYTHIGLGKESGVLVGSMSGYPDSGFFPSDEERALNTAFVLEAVRSYYPTLAALQAAEGRVISITAALYDYIREYGWPSDPEANKQLRALLSPKEDRP